MPVFGSNVADLLAWADSVREAWPRGVPGDPDSEREDDYPTSNIVFALK